MRLPQRVREDMVWTTNLHSRESQQNRLCTESQSVSEVRVVVGLVCVTPISSEVLQAINPYLVHCDAKLKSQSLTMPFWYGKDLCQPSEGSQMTHT